MKKPKDNYCGIDRDKLDPEVLKVLDGEPEGTSTSAQRKERRHQEKHRKFPEEIRAATTGSDSMVRNPAALDEESENDDTLSAEEAKFYALRLGAGSGWIPLIRQWARTRFERRVGTIEVGRSDKQLAALKYGDVIDDPEWEAGGWATERRGWNRIGTGGAIAGASPEIVQQTKAWSRKPLLARLIKHFDQISFPTRDPKLAEYLERTTGSRGLRRGKRYDYAGRYLSQKEFALLALALGDVPKRTRRDRTWGDIVRKQMERAKKALVKYGAQPGPLSGDFFPDESPTLTRAERAGKVAFKNNVGGVENNSQPSIKPRIYRGILSRK